MDFNFYHHHCRMQTRNDGMLKLSDKLREERKKKSEELIERMKEKAKEKMAASKDGTIYLDDTDMRTIIEAAREEEAGKTTGKEQVQAGANLDLQI